jgi:hypothetical protein
MCSYWQAKTLQKNYLIQGQKYELFTVQYLQNELPLMALN